ncbi:MAG: 3-hydroxyacyl-CoA dehydrogenase NAD-binding domain-containing protein [Lentihominibacter sp.]|nr:3-hydroxyacyl-CoA dehydrogenase NAD-binding domain-containing protein [Clostridiales bacterium]MDY2679777.1 3-hydroxyacyl-CoA dehydrogenase NAD-binding domain-containing protein [Lentihominibacter sp.]
MNIEKLFVIGAGFMGSGIVENAAVKGLNVTVYDISQKQLDRSIGGITKNLEKSVAKGRMDAADKDAALSRIKCSTEITDCCDADAIIEAVSENRDIKVSIMKEIDKYAKEDAVIASNTSSISITSLGSVFRNPERFVGMHFFSPVPRMPLMEIVRGYQTSDEALERARKLGEFMGKSCIIAQDEAGFIVNRMLIPMLNEACVLVERRIGTIEEIDRGVKLGLNHPMGPLELMDMIGIDVELAVMEVLHHELGDPKYRPAVSLRRMVDSGFLGKKTGAGFYIYHEDGTKEPNPNLLKLR